MVYGGSVNLEGNLSIDSKDRLEVGLATARKMGNEVTLIYCVSKEFQAEHRVAERSIEYFLSQSWPKERLRWNPVGSNTFTEALGAVRVLENEKTKEVTVVTHWYHIPRTWLCWKLLGWQGKIHFAACWKTGNAIASLIWEILGFGKLLWRILNGQVASAKFS